MTQSAPDLPTKTYRSASIAGRKPLHFTYTPSAPERAAIAAHLGLLSLDSLVMKGVFTPQGRADVVLRAVLTAQVAQPCVITLVPVPAQITSEIARDYLHDFAFSTAAEAELGPEDQEPLPEEFDLAEIAIEELSLSLPPYPRAPGAELAPVIAAPEGAEPLTDEAIRPFAGLASLAASMSAKQPADALAKHTQTPDQPPNRQAAQNKGKIPK